jgi:SHS2 domain-containing protein
VHVEAPSAAFLLHHCLRELLHLFEDGQLPVEVHAGVEEEPWRASMSVGVLPVAAVRERLKGEVKAVTYHNLALRREGDTLWVEVVFDT